MVTKVEIELLISKYLQHREYEKLDALYMWSLCQGGSGFCVNFELKYGSRKKCLEAIRDLEKIIGKILTGFEVTEDTGEYLVEVVRELLENNKHIINTLRQEVLNRIVKLSQNAKKLVLLLCREGTVLLRNIHAHELILDKIINKVFRKFSTFEVVKEILSSGLLIACYWTPRDESFHIFHIPKYAVEIWFEKFCKY